MPETEDLYEILNLHPSAHPGVIEAAYQRLALLYYPGTDPIPGSRRVDSRNQQSLCGIGRPGKTSRLRPSASSSVTRNNIA